MQAVDVLPGQKCVRAWGEEASVPKLFLRQNSSSGVQKNSTKFRRGGGKGTNVFYSNRFVTFLICNLQQHGKLTFFPSRLDIWKEQEPIFSPE